MKKLAILSVVSIMLFSLVGCMGVSEDYTMSEVSIDDAPQVVFDEANEVTLERGHMIFPASEYGLDNTYILIIGDTGDEPVTVVDDEVDMGILRITVDEMLSDEDVDTLDGHPVLLVRIDTDADMATINDLDNIGYPLLSPVE